MPIKIPESTKQLAFEMRKDNKTYAEISETTGISLRWCKQHLKDVVSDYEQKIEELCSKSKTPSAITKTEIIKTLQISGNRKEVLNKTKDIVKKIKAKDKDNLVRPAWMTPAAARLVAQSVIAAIELLEDRLNEVAIDIHNDVLDCLPEELSDTAPTVNALKQTISALLAATQSHSSGSNEVLMRWFNSIDSTSVELSKRNKMNTPHRLTKESNFDDELFDEDDIPY